MASPFQARSYHLSSLSFTMDSTYQESPGKSVHQLMVAITSMWVVVPSSLVTSTHPFTDSFAIAASQTNTSHSSPSEKMPVVTFRQRFHPSRSVVSTISIFSPSRVISSLRLKLTSSSWVTCSRACSSHLLVLKSSTLTRSSHNSSPSKSPQSQLKRTSLSKEWTRSSARWAMTFASPFT